MLIEFRISNYRSIAEEQVISLEPAPKQREYEENVIGNEKFSVLNAIAFYGPNSSGKSNLLRAMEVLDKMVSMSSKTNSTEKLPYDPFLLKEGYAKKPTNFELTFVIDGTRYRYGFAYNADKILEEWLYRKKVGREVELFLRKKDTVEVFSSFKGSQKIFDAAIEATRENALFLSFCDMFNIEEAKTIFLWFEKFIYVDGLDTSSEAINTFRLLTNPIYKVKIKKYLAALGLGFNDIFIEQKEFDPNELPNFLPDSERQSLIKTLSGKVGLKPQTVHHFYDKKGNLTKTKVVWPLEERESEGTKKAIHFSGPVIYTLINGGVLVVDEIEAKIHPLLTLQTLNLFLNKETNPLNAQIIFATHDTNILQYSKLRRDQINFVEKNHWEATEIYALSDITYKDIKLKERHDTDKEKRYLEGRYGAIPQFNESQLLQIDD